MTHQEIEVPEDPAVLNQAVDAATGGTVTYLTRQGQRLAAIVPAELVELLLPEPYTDADHLGLSVDKSRRRLELLARVQGVRPVTDPAGRCCVRLDWATVGQVGALLRRRWRVR